MSALANPAINRPVVATLAIFTPRAPAPEIAYFANPDHPGEDISTLDV